MEIKKNSYHGILSQYFGTKEYFLESFEQQRVHAQHKPPSSRKINLRKVMELPWQEIQAEFWTKMKDLLTDLSFIEAKAEAGKIFDLADDFTYFIDATKKSLPGGAIINLMEEAIREDIHFISKHPTTIFQCLFNSCFWVDNPSAEILFEDTYQTGFYECSENKRDKIYELMERWLIEKQELGFGNYWVKSLRPFHQLYATSGLLVLRGHISPIQTVEFCPKGNLVASGSAYLAGCESISTKTGVYMLDMNALEIEVPSYPMYQKDNSIRLWNSKNAKLDYSIESLEGPVLNCSFSPDGKFLAYTCLPDGNIHVFDILQRQEINCLYGSGTRVNRVAFSPDGLYIASAGTDGYVRIRETLTGADEHFFKTEDSIITDIKYSPDGRFLAFSSRSIVDKDSNNTLNVIDSDTGVTLCNFSCESNCTIMSISFLPDGQEIIGGTSNHEVLIYNLIDGSKKFVGKHNGEVLSVAVSFDGRLAVSGSTDTTVRVWSLEKLTESACFNGHNDLVNAVSFSPDGLQVASGSADCTVRIRPVTIFDESQSQFIEHKKDITDLRFSKSGKYLASGSEEGRINLYDDSGICHKYFENCGKITKVKFSNREDKLFSTDNILISVHEFDGNSVLLQPRRDTKKNNEKEFLYGLPEKAHTFDKQRIEIAKSARFELSDFVITNDDSQIIAGCWNGSLCVWNSVSGLEMCFYRAENEKLIGLMYSVNDQRIVYSKEVTCMVISSNNKYIACGSADGTVRLWDLINLNGLSHFRHCTKVNSIAFSHDNSMVASGAENGEIFVWEFPGNSFQSLRIHEKPVLNLAFGQKGNSLFSSSSEKTAITDLSSQNTKFHNGRGDVTGMSSMINMDSPVPFIINFETVITDPINGSILAWFPSSMKYLCSHPKKSVWAGAESNQLRMFTLEKFEN